MKGFIGGQKTETGLINKIYCRNSMPIQNHTYSKPHLFKITLKPTLKIKFIGSLFYSQLVSSQHL